MLRWGAGKNHDSRARRQRVLQSAGHHQVKRRPGASPLLFGQFLMELAAFISLEDIACDLPPYTEEVIGVQMDPPCALHISRLEDAVKGALKEHRGNISVLSVGLNALLITLTGPTTSENCSAGSSIRRPSGARGS